MLQELFRIPLPEFLQNWFHLGPAIPIYGYGLMMVIGFLVAAHFAKWLANRSGLDGEAFVNAALIALVTGIIGARVSHILENTGDFFRSERSAWENFWNMVNLTSGGLTYYGGFLLAFPILVLYARRKKVPLGVGMDIVAPALMIGLGFGRIGCYLNGCCYGAICPTNFAAGVEFPYGSNPYVDHFNNGHIKVKTADGKGEVPKELVLDVKGRPHTLTKDELREVPRIAALLAQSDETAVQRKLRMDARYANDDYLIAMMAHARAYGGEDLDALAAAQRSLPVHPAQLYSAFTAFLLAGLLTAFYTLPHTAGRGFALMLMLEGSSRFLLELLRTEPPVLGPYFSLSMVIGLCMVALGVLLWYAFGRWPRRVEPSPALAAAA